MSPLAPIGGLELTARSWLACKCDWRFSQTPSTFCFFTLKLFSSKHLGNAPLGKFSLVYSLITIEPRRWVFWSSLACLFLTGVQLVVGVTRLRMWSELAPLPFQSKVLSAQCASSVPAMNQLRREGSTLLSSISQAGFGRARCGFGTTWSSLGRSAEAIKRTDPLASTFASRINSLGSLPRAHDHDWI